MNDIMHVERCVIDFIAQADSEVNASLRVIDSKTNEPEVFKSEKLIASLVCMGIPLTLSLRIISIISESILKNRPDGDLETSQIRSMVRNTLYSLHNLDGIDADEQQCQNWGDFYLRKYGYLGGPIEIEHRNGNLDELSYKNVRNNIIPEALADILCTERSEIKKGFPLQFRKSMANELMRVVNELGIYRIQHQVLMDITRELAMQPPHPWAIRPVDSWKHIETNLTKSQKHLDDFESFYQKNRFDEHCRHAIREFLYHSSASVLIYYNGIPGFGDLSAFYSLSNSVNKVINGRYIFEGCIIQQIEQDLQMHGTSLKKFIALLKDLDKYSAIMYQDKALIQMRPLLYEYFTICNKLVSGKILLKKKFEAAVSYKGGSDEKGKLLEEVAKSIFSLSSCFTVRNNVQRNHKQYDIEILHESDYGLFKKIDNVIYVECKNTNRRIGRDVIESFGRRVTKIPFCNMGIIISPNGFSSGAIVETKKFLDEGAILILLDKHDIYGLLENDLIKELDEKIKRLYFL